MKWKETEPEPLWREVVGDTEPWRRGRLFLVLLAVLTFCLQALSFWGFILTGDIQRILGLAIAALIFWVQYYFIWIGVHWVRWLTGGWNALVGFAFIIWGLRDGSGFLIVLGVYYFGTGLYLGFAPAVYFFAKRQRETVRWKESLVIAAVFLLLLGSFSAGIFGLAAHKSQLNREAHEFADMAFVRIFSEHDTHFLLDHATEGLLQDGGGRAGLSKFNQEAMIYAGDVHEFKRLSGSFRFWYAFPFQIGSAGDIITEAVGTRGPVKLQLRLVEAGSGWKIDGIWWTYLHMVPIP
jgi:hypothetical protein